MRSEPDYKQLQSSDFLFFYAENELDYRDACLHDIYEIALQPNRSMYYFREYGAGQRYNFPVSLTERIMIPFNIANAIAKRNLYVSDGSGGIPDMRIATSQDAISFSVDDMGNIDITVLYFLYADLRDRQSARLQVNGG
jgi:hypothetical protein